MVDWPKPNSPRALRGFLGLTGYYRKYVANYGSISRPFTDLLNKDSFKWNEEADKAFTALKTVMSSTPVWILPDYSKEFIIETDASNNGIGLCFNARGKPVAYFSKVLAPKHRGKSTYEKEYMALLAVQTFCGTQLHYSSAYHPQSDGQTERVNKCLENYLRCMTSNRPTNWKHWLNAAEWWYNTNFHTSLQCTPFEDLYGYSPPHLSLGPLLETLVQAAEDTIMRRQQMQQLLKDNLSKAQERMKHYADKKRTDREFQVGDMVYLTLQPYRQTSIALRKNLKLSSKYYGPYPVPARVGRVAYKLDLPSNSKVHPVFHVSLLKRKANGQKEQCSNGQGVQWSNLPPEDATWEDYQFLKSKFPNFDSHP
ncbi:uncharacterized protein LOC132062018 [Lycium ferocissimum]|uniref:uncharacterized protein LOC132062018 n=1 Tax=Lycium ferocissimum TaxID=112874 RepID=UPI002814CEC7|nr:uncharacterized protein LOC132062018 [Lycium ferocissimum]